jgi:hypothetical protein
MEFSLTIKYAEAAARVLAAVLSFGGGWGIDSPTLKPLGKCPPLAAAQL